MKTLVTGGCFDVLHYGHKQFINSLLNKTNTTKLILLLKSDRAISEKKGSIRPLFTYDWRYNDLVNYLNTLNIEFSIIKLDTNDISILNNYISTNYIIGLPSSNSYYQPNIIKIDEINTIHTSDITNLLNTKKLESNCNLINIASVLVREGSIVASSCNGYSTCNRCHSNIANKCTLKHSEELVLEQAIKGDDLFITHSPCINCAKLILNKQINRVVYLEDYVHLESLNYLLNNNVKIRKAGINE